MPACGQQAVDLPGCRYADRRGVHHGADTSSRGGGDLHRHVLGCRNRRAGSGRRRRRDPPVRPGRRRMPPRPDCVPAPQGRGSPRRDPLPIRFPARTLPMLPRPTKPTCRHGQPSVLLFGRGRPTAIVGRTPRPARPSTAGNPEEQLVQFLLVGHAGPRAGRRTWSRNSSIRPRAAVMARTTRLRSRRAEAPSWVHTPQAIDVR